jgi:hypothetical protein
MREIDVIRQQAFTICQEEEMGEGGAEVKMSDKGCELMGETAPEVCQT